MPLIDVHETDSFRFVMDPVKRKDWYWTTNVREVTPEEETEIAELVVAYTRLQELLKEIYRRPEVKLNGPEDVTEVTE